MGHKFELAQLIFGSWNKEFVFESELHKKTNLCFLT